MAAARRDYLDESGGRYVHVIADGSIGCSGDIAKAVARGVPTGHGRLSVARANEAPARASTGDRSTRPSCRVASGYEFGTIGSLQEILFGPSRIADER